MSSGPHSPEWNVVRALLALVRQKDGPDCALVEVSYKVVKPGDFPKTVTWDTTLAALEQAARAAAQSDERDDRSSVRRRILEVLRAADKPIPKASIVAQRAGLENTPHFRTVFKTMQREGIVLPPERGGYWLAERELP